MKFATKCDASAATASDITLAERQQSLVSFELNGATIGSGGVGRKSRMSKAPTFVDTSIRRSFPFFGFSVLFFVLSVVSFFVASDRVKKLQSKSGMANSTGDDGIFRDDFLKGGLAEGVKAVSRSVTSTFSAKDNSNEQHILDSNEASSPYVAADEPVQAPSKKGFSRFFKGWRNPNVRPIS
jgi:hypothetical protein